MTGVDGADLLRQVRLQPDESDPNTLVLTPEYKAQVNEMHSRLEAQARTLKAGQAPGLILEDDGPNDN